MKGKESKRLAFARVGGYPCIQWIGRLRRLIALGSVLMLVPTLLIDADRAKAGHESYPLLSARGLSEGLLPADTVAVVTTWAGNDSHATIDGVGSEASFTAMGGVAVAGGYAYVGTYGAIRRVDLQTKAVWTLAGVPWGQYGCLDSDDPALAQFPQILDVATNGAFVYTLQDCYVPDEGIVRTLRRTSIPTRATETVAAFPGAEAMTVVDGTLFVVGQDPWLLQLDIWQVDPDSGNASVFSQIQLADYPSRLDAALTHDDSALWLSFKSYFEWPTKPGGSRAVAAAAQELAPSSGGIFRIGLADQVLTQIPILDWDFAPLAIAVAEDHLYLPWAGGTGLRLYDKSTGEFLNVAGDGLWGYADGIGAEVRFGRIDGLAVEGDSVWVADRGNYRLRQARLTTAPPQTYVAMGDSYQAGVGAPPYIAGTDTDDPVPNHCKRSELAYPARLVDYGIVEFDLDFVACGGAEVADLFERGQSTSGPPYDEGSQLAHLDSNTRLVTIGIGGNDVGFSEAMMACLASGLLNSSCLAVEGPRVATRLAELTSPNPFSGLSPLEELFATIRAAAPHARILVLGYPHLFAVGLDLSSLFGLFGPRCQGITVLDQLWMNAGVRLLNDGIKRAAENQGLQYIEMYEASDSYDLCHFGFERQFFHGFEGASGDSFHPTPFGYERMVDEIGSAMGYSPGQLFWMRMGDTIATSIDLIGGGSASFSTSWAGSDVSMKLVSPSGRVIDRDTEAPDVYHSSGPTDELFRIQDPEPGTWTVQLFGADIPPGGEEVRLTTYEQPAINEAPAASFTMSVDGAVVSVDAEGSVDPDGDIVQYLWDFGDGTLEEGVTATHTYDAPGTYRVGLAVQDDEGGLGFDVATYDIEVTSQLYDFTGFFPPVNNSPVVNAMNAGRAVPVKFSLGGDFGLDIFEPSSPYVQRVDCVTGAPLDEVETTVLAGGSELTYDPASDTYSYVWKTNKLWSDSCRALTLALSDGSEHTAEFRFR